MSVETDICSVLLALCPRVFPDFAAVSTLRPYVTYQQIGGQAVGFVGRDLPSKKNGEIQINVWADTRMEASALALQIEAAMIAATAFQASAIGAAAGDFDADIPVYGCRQDFTVWSDR